MAEELHAEQKGMITRRIPSGGAKSCASTTLWAHPPSIVRIEANAVHLWQASLTLEPELLTALRATLSAEEEKRAEQFSVSTLRERYIAGRGILRNILGRYLGESPDRIRFRYTEYGKPELVDGRHLSFNLSHTRDRALYAITDGRRIGVDIECLDRPAHSNRLKLAKRFFSQREYTDLRQTHQAEQNEAFLRCWTRKEAFIKAIGQGLTCPLDQFDVTLTRHEPAALLATRWGASEAGQWSMAHIEPAPDAVGAVVVEGASPRIARWRWTTDAVEIGPLPETQPGSITGAHVCQQH